MTTREWKKIAVRLSKALDRFILDCNELDHRPSEYHKGGEECPVVSEILEVKEDFNTMIKKEVGQ